MSFNGSGTFIINSAGQPVVANTVISATVFNALTADLATGLTNCITRDGQSTPTANIPMGNNKLTGLGAGTAATDAATLGQVQSTAAKLITVTGTDTISGTMSPALTAYASGQLFYFIANAANTGAMTINIDGLGAKNITRDGSTALIAGDVVSGEIVVICYDGTRFQMINAANSFGNTTINGTLTVTGNTGLQANVSITSALSVGGVFAVTGAATLGSTLEVTGKSDLPTVSTASMNAAVAVITTGTVTNLTSTSASVASMNAGVALLTTATVTTLTATGASIASANIGNLQFTAASIASINAGVAVITNLTVTGASIASMNGSVANITTVNATTVDATNVEVTNVKAKDGTSAITIADTSGNVGIGGTAGASVKFQVLGNLPVSGGTSIGQQISGAFTSGTTSNGYNYVSFPSVENASFTLGNLYGFWAGQGTKGASATITNQYGYYVDSSLTGATNNYGFYSNIASGSNRWNFYAAGTAANYFAGNVLVGATSAINSSKFSVESGTTNATTYNVAATRGGSTLTVQQQQTTSVSTSAAVILDPGGLYASLCLVYGHDGSGNRFCDLVLFSIGTGTFNVISSLNASGSPAARTYSQASSTYKLAMASGTYTVQVSALTMDG